jgi:hypothetical protein
MKEVGFSETSVATAEIYFSLSGFEHVHRSGRSLAGIAGSKPDWGIDVCLV